jgi:signal transduction histidine kinase
MTNSIRSVVTSMRRNWPARYAVSLGLALLVSFLKIHVGWLAPETLFFAVVMFSAWFGGTGPGLLATGVATAAGMYFAPPVGVFSVASRDDVARLTIAAAEGLTIALLGGALYARNESLRGELTERARAEASLLRVTEQLHHAQKMQAFGEFAGSVAHDFNNMITVVLASASTLERRLAKGDSAREEVKAIREAGERAADLTRKLLTFARRQPTRRSVVDLHEVIARIEPIVRRVVGKPIELTLSLQAARSRILADAPQLEQAIVNLAANARDAMPDGGTVSISTADLPDAVVRTRARAPRPHVELSIRDTGIGMDDATKARALEPFFTTKPVGQGTGLGLSVVFGIVEAMGGVLSIDSAPGQGATFRLWLPLATE